VRKAYLDSSCLVAFTLDEPGSKGFFARLARFDRLFSSNLLEAELRSALAREGRPGVLRNPVALLHWVFPPQRLTREIDLILEEGFLKGPDLWHLACALFLHSKVKDLTFLTLDGRQGDIARSLGFRGF
jgi:hypothetical protein